MFKIKKQLSKLYISSILGNLSLTGAWVAILAARGFSLPQIGFAETVFHIVSIIFELPSGVLADVFGRKRMLMVSTIMRTIGNIVMVFSNNYFMVCISIGFQALSYNFASGSDQALAYDSMKKVDKADCFDKYVSNQLIIYRVGSGISTLCAGFALFLGYRVAYSISSVTSVMQLFILASLDEIKASNVNIDGSLCKIMGAFRNVITESISFVKKSGKAVRLMLCNSLVGAVDILLLFFLQAKLSEKGLNGFWLGVALLIMEFGGILGAKLILKLPKLRYQVLYFATLALVLLGLLAEHSQYYAIMTLGGFMAAAADDALQVRTNAKLQEMFPSEQRATLTSLDSFSFSMIMIVLSPLAGMFFTVW